MRNTDSNPRKALQAAIATPIALVSQATTLTGEDGDDECDDSRFTQFRSSREKSCCGDDVMRLPSPGWTNTLTMNERSVLHPILMMRWRLKLGPGSFFFFLTND
jgi:hypothetical protein